MPPKVAKKKASSPMNANKFHNLVAEYKPNNLVEISPKGWVLPNRVKFPTWTQETFKYSGQDKSELFPSQRFVKDFLQYDSPYRGVLLLHGLGLGKSYASILTAENLIGQMDVIVMLPASLRSNYIQEIKHRGGNKFFSIHNNWKFVALSNIADVMKLVTDNTFADEKVIKKNKGLWVAQKSGASNWNSLSDDDKAAINLQLNAMIQNKYKFINYNGITNKNIDELVAETDHTSGNPFDNKVVVVDEVHNLISRTVGNGRIGKRVYDLLLRAENAKLILLSGTPMINYPHESAMIINLLKGPQYVHEFSFAKNAAFNADNVSELLDKHAYVDNYTLDSLKKKAFIQLAPIGFKFTNKVELTVERDTSNVTLETIKQDITKTLKCAFTATAVKYVLPVDKEEFTSRFINFDKDGVNNARMLSRRMMGCVSYFGTYFGDLYPRMLPASHVLLDMSDYQFGVYEKSRFEELKKEDGAKRMKKKAPVGDLFDSTGQVYRAYSRANCNFVFPEEIQRPYPSKIGMMAKEVDWNEDDGHVAGEDAKVEGKDEKAYQAALVACLKKLADNEDKYLVPGRLEMYSPKFNAMVQHLNKCKGKSLVYSQFRTIEGLGVLSKVLDANGWTEFKIKKTANGGWDLDVPDEDMLKPKYFQYRGSEEETQFLMKIFNNDLADMPDTLKRRFPDMNNLRGDIIKLIMITQSGAEGISLKHVREVHITEPYWNEIRINQVIGRAVRAGSHVDLPDSERTVKVFTYIVKMTDKQLKSSKTIQNKDKSNGKPATTDEYIFNVAARKAKIINAIQDLMKNASVDCLVHNKYHNASVKCLTFPKNSPPNELSYHLDYEKEENDVEYKQKVKVVKEKDVGTYKKCKLNGTFYAFNMTTRVLYDYNAYLNGKLEKFGTLEVDEETGRQKLVRA